MPMLPHRYAGLPELVGLPRWKPRLLLVDDDPSCIASLRRHLRRDYDVVPCRTAMEALYAFEQEPPAVMVIDYVLPDVDGVQIASVLRDCTIGDIPTIVISGHSRSRVPIGSLDIDFLEKPFDPAVLVSLIERRLP